jgi:hypothetical protein
MNAIPNPSVHGHPHAFEIARAFTEGNPLPRVRIENLQDQASTMPLDEVRPSEIRIDLYANAPRNLFPAQPSAMDRGPSSLIRSNIGLGSSGAQNGVPQEIVVPVIASNQLQPVARRDVVGHSPCDDFKEGCKAFCQNRETDRDCVKYARCGTMYTLATVGCLVSCGLVACILGCIGASGSGFSGGRCDCPGPDRFEKSFCPD